MVEMVILLPVMITMWFGIDYFRSGYARRLTALGTSQTRAWKLAQSNDGSCFANKEPFAGFGGENDVTDASNVGTKGAEAGQQFQNNSDSSMFLYAHANQVAQMSTRKARFDGDKTGTVKGGTYVTCNEVVPDGANYGDQNVLTPLWDFVKSIFK